MGILRGASACSEVMKSMRPLMPPPWAIACMRRPNSRAMKKPERTLVLTMASQVASETVSGVSTSRRAGEAECTNKVTGRLSGGSAVREPSVVARSTVTASASPPAATISATIVALRAGSTSAQRTAAPSRANASAMARPMLEAEPVTSACSPLKRPSGVMANLERSWDAAPYTTVQVLRGRMAEETAEGCRPM